MFVSIVTAYFFFFFSSRRRHTRLVSDWSSDVCSSDLDAGRASSPLTGPESIATPAAPSPRSSRICVNAPPNRSEERRVGKECRSRWGADHKKKKRNNEKYVRETRKKEESTTETLKEIR